MPPEDQGQSEQTPEPSDTDTANESGQSEATPEPKDEPKFSKAQLQQLSSMVGSIVKNQVDKKVDELKPYFENSSAAVRPSPNLTDGLSNNPATKQFNDELLEQMLSGDVVGALEKYRRLQEQTNTNLSRTRKSQLDKSIENFSEQPYYNEVKDTVAKLSEEKLSQGWPAAAAAEHGYTLAVRQHLESKLNSNSDGGELGLESGGRHPRSKGPIKLPPNFEAAYLRDHAKGLFKTREEFVENLDPKVRQQIGI